MSPVAVLKNGIKVCNFSSPHSFTFDDGTILPAVSPEFSKEMNLNIVEIQEVSPCRTWLDIKIEISLTPNIISHLCKLHADDEIDVIITPFMVLEALKSAGHNIGKCRVIRTADRISKVIHSDRFCV